MKQKLYYFAYIVGAQSLCAIPVYWLTTPGTMVCFSLMIAYIIACLLGYMYILEGCMSNALLRTLLLIVTIIVFVPGCIFMLLGTFIIAINVGLLPAILSLLSGVLYFVWAAITLPQKIGHNMNQSGVFT